MNARKTILVAVILAAAVGGYLWDQMHMIRERREADRRLRLTPGKYEEIIRVSFETAGAPAIEAERDEEAPGDRWRMTRPLDCRADMPAIKKILLALDKVSTADAFEIGKNETDYGLDASALTFSLWTRDSKKTLTVETGAITPDGAGRYARREGESQVFVLEKHLCDLMMAGMDDFRDQNLMPFKPRNARLLEYGRGPVEVRLEQHTKNWTMGVRNADAGTSTACDLDVNALADFFLALDNARPLGFVDDAADDLTSWGLANPAVAYRFTLFDDLGGAAHTLKIGAPLPGCARRYAQYDDERWAITLGPETAAKLSLSTNAFRSKKLFHQEYEQIDAMTIIVRGEAINLIRPPGELWTMKNHPELTLDQDKVESLARHALNVKIAEFVDSEPNTLDSGLDRPNIEINIQSGGETVSETLLTGRKASGRNLVHARQLETGRYVMIDWREPGRFFIEPTDIEDTLMFRFDPAEVKQVEISEGGRSMFFTRQSSGDWAAGMRGVEGGMIAPAEAMDEVVACFGYLRWQVRIDPETVEGWNEIVTCGLQEPAKKMTLYDAAGQEILSLGEGARTPRRMYVRRGADEYFGVDSLNYAQLAKAISAMFKSMAEAAHEAAPQSADEAAVKTQ